MFYKRFIVLYNIPQRVYFCLNRVGFGPLQVAFGSSAKVGRREIKQLQNL